MAKHKRLLDRYRSWLYPALAAIDPERAHHLALRALKITSSAAFGVSWLAPPVDERLRIRQFGLEFVNPLGAAAGLDKDADAVTGLLKLGFSAVEVGAVTPLPQPGNPRPRLWRFPEERALINALGFPSIGAAVVRQRLAGQQFPGVIGVNLGKNRSTATESAVEDYMSVVESLWDMTDYFTVNVSSPNTPGLRDLQRREALLDILRPVMEQNRNLAELHKSHSRPVLVKIAPDLTDEALDEVISGIIDGEASGVVVCNTTTDHRLLGRKTTQLPGGLSGRPLRSLALDMTRKVYRRTGGELPIIGVGGIEDAQDVIQRMKAGASLVQIYTAFVYGGPALPGVIVHDLIDYVDREGLKSISDIVGIDTEPDEPEICHSA